MITILEKIYKSGLKFLEPISLSETFTLAPEEAAKLLSADWAALYIGDKDELKEVARYPRESRLPYEPRKRGFTYRAYMEKKTYIIKKEEMNRIHPELRKLSFEAAICVPLAYQKKSIGALVLFAREDRKFTSKELGLLKIFGSYVTLGIRRAQQHAETRDALEKRDLFISMAAHELRTPLTSVNGYIQLLKTKLSGGDNVESRWIDQLYWESVRLSGLVNELLEINRIKTGQLQYFLKECSLREIVERVKSNFRFSYPERELIVEDKLGNKSDILIGDYDKILQVFANLMDNAVKYSPSDSKVYLILEAKDQYFTIKVKDFGIGIHRGEQSKIFEGFHQGMGHNKEGLGLGLFLVKDIITRLHGEIKLHSKIGKGTTFEIKLPAVNPD